MKESIEAINDKLAFLDEIIFEKTSLLESLKSSIKSIEGYAIGTRDLAINNESVHAQRKKEVLELLSQQKITGEAYAIVDSILADFQSINKTALFDVEKVLLGRQCELNACISEIEKLSTKRLELVKKIEEMEVHAAIEKRRENGVRPDMNVKTAAGRAAIDLKQRKNSKKSLS